MAVIAAVDGTPSATALPAPKRPRILSAILLTGWGCLAAWSGATLAMSWPYVGSMPQWLLMLAFPGILFRASDLAWLHFRSRRISGWRRGLMRVAAIVAGVVAAGYAWEGLDAISWSRFQRAVAPLTATAAKGPEAVCGGGTVPGFDRSVIEYLDAVDAPRAPAELYWGDGRFVLALAGRSMDIDGSTLYFDSRVQQWRKVHNDTLQRTGELNAATAGLVSCRFSLRE